ncbi:MAG: hypothetical protein ACSLE6_06785 [Mycobacterium sp.]
MTGTAIVPIALGPWRGAAVGGLTNLIGVLGSGWISLPFALANITGALVWGDGVQRWGMGRSLRRFIALNVLTALACSSVAVPLILVLLGHDLDLGRDAVTRSIEGSIDTFVLAAGFSNVVTSVGDKLVSGFVALVVISELPAGIRRRSRMIIVGGQL